jgi:hypothetical protein
MNELRIRNVRFANGQIVVDLYQRETVADWLKKFPRLQAASTKQRKQWQLIGRGRGVHWVDPNPFDKLRAG